MNKKDIIAALIAQTRAEVEQLRTEEKENLDTIDHEDQDNMNAYESTAESQTATILQEDEPLTHAQERLAALERLTGEPSSAVEFGSLVKLNTGTLLVATSFQTVELEGEKVTGISTASPIFQKMQGLSSGAQFHLTDHPQEYIILDIH